MDIYYTQKVNQAFNDMHAAAEKYRRVHVLKGLVHLLCIVDIHILSLFFRFVSQS